MNEPHGEVRRRAPQRATRTPPRVVVMGGSLGGLTAALVLGDIGCDVDVFERSQVPLMGRGAGIVVHPVTVRYLVDNAVGDIRHTTAPALWVRYLAADGSVAHEAPCRFRFSSYYALYRDLLSCFDPERYHLGSGIRSFGQDAEGVTIHLANGGTRRSELLVAADGIHSTARRILLPDVERRYAGYVAWRGTVDERQLTRETFGILHETVTYFVMPSSHILAYPIPSVDGSLEPGRRLTNWVWYRNVEPGEAFDDLMTDRHGRRSDVSMNAGAVQERHVELLRQNAAELLPPPLAEVVRKTEQPFVQAVYDVEVPRMAFGRICLIGDAAFALRPHAAVGTAKAAQDAWALAEAMKETGLDPVEALRRWEPGQLALGRQALARTREAGIRSQFENSWRVGDPLPFGLYASGDSSVPPEWMEPAASDDAPRAHAKAAPAEG